MLRHTKHLAGAKPRCLLPPPHSRSKLFSTRPEPPSSFPFPPLVPLRHLALFAGGCILGGGVCYYYRTQNHPKTFELKAGERPVTAAIASLPAITVSGEKILWGELQPWSQTSLLLSTDEAEAFLRQGEKSVKVERPGNVVVRYDVNSLASNEPNEDRYAVDLVPTDHLGALVEERHPKSFWERWVDVRDPIGSSASKPGGQKQGEALEASRYAIEDGLLDLTMISVFDGHCGWSVSDLAEKTLHPILAWALAARGDKVPSWFAQMQGGLEADARLPKDSEAFVKLLKDVYKSIDQSIMNAPITPLTAPLVTGAPAPLSNAPDAAQIHLAKLEGVGSCSITAVVDSANDKLYVANAGDTRAVAGWWSSTEKMWRCDVLSEDQCGSNPNEQARVKAEHPSKEADDLFVPDDPADGPRVLGNIMITRAFGDSGLKREEADHFLINRALDGKIQPAPRPRLTPPYMTAEPEVTVRDLHPESKEELKFLIVATDGLWDCLSSEEAARAVAAHLNHPVHEDVPAAQLAERLPSLPPGVDSGYPTNTARFPLEKTKQIFEDENAATHLIRNALCGGDRSKLRNSLSLRGKGARKVRGDITVVVVHFGEGEGAFRED